MMPIIAVATLGVASIGLLSWRMRYRRRRRRRRVTYYVG